MPLKDFLPHPPNEGPPLPQKYSPKWKEIIPEDKKPAKKDLELRQGAIIG